MRGPDGKTLKGASPACFCCPFIASRLSLLVYLSRILKSPPLAASFRAINPDLVCVSYFSHRRDKTPEKQLKEGWNPGSQFEDDLEFQILPSPSTF